MKRERLKHRYSLIIVLLAMSIFVPSVCISANSNDELPGEIVIYDGLGREIRLKEPAQRVYNSYGIAATMVFALGAQDKLVGLDPETKEKAVYVAWPPKGPSGSNIEDIIALDADFVLVSAGNQDLIKVMETHGINVFGVAAENLDQLTDSMINLGKAFGKEERAKLFTSYYDEMVAKIKNRTAHLTQEERTGVYLAGSSLLSTCGEKMYQHHIIELAGGRNVALSDNDEIMLGERWIEISPEHIVRWNPEIIVVVPYVADTTPEEILKDERFQGVNAVKNGQVFWFPSNLIPWDYPSPQAILGIEWLAKKLHPQLFADLDVMDEANKFFNMLYGVTYSELGGVLD